MAFAAALVLASAIMHAAWNILLKTSDDPLRLSARAIPAATLAVTPLAAVAWFATGRPSLPWPAVGLAVLSGAVELAYFQFLSRAYRRGEISSVYPVARGTAPLLAATAGVVLLGERMDHWQAAGVVTLVAGVWLARPLGRGQSALVPALATGACIAGYTVLDRVGVRMGPVWLYAWAVFASMSLWLLPFRGRGRVAAVPVVGLLTLGAYSLVLLALSIAPLALVAPLRESGVVIVALWGVTRLGEREGARMKLAGAGAVVAGAALITVG